MTIKLELRLHDRVLRHGATARYTVYVVEFALDQHLSRHLMVSRDSYLDKLMHRLLALGKKPAIKDPEHPMSLTFDLDDSDLELFKYVWMLGAHAGKLRIWKKLYLLLNDGGTKNMVLDEIKLHVVAKILTRS